MLQLLLLIVLSSYSFSSFAKIEIRESFGAPFSDPEKINGIVGIITNVIYPSASSDEPNRILVEIEASEDHNLGFESRNLIITFTDKDYDIGSKLIGAIGKEIILVPSRYNQSKFSIFIEFISIKNKKIVFSEQL